MLNNPAASAAARKPRALAIINGAAAAGLVEIEVDSNSFYQADTFQAVFALSKQPSGTNWGWWASQTALQVQLFAGFPTDPEKFGMSDLSLLILGNVDDIDIDPVRDQIRITGRDLTSNFVDAQTVDKWPGYTSSRIAAKLAARHNLQTAITKTTVQVGNYYVREHVLENRRITEWDLLTYLARQEDFSVFVRGTTLYFQPKAQPTDDPYVIQWQPPQSGSAAAPVGNFTAIRFARSLTIARDVVVFVKGFDYKTNKSYSVKRSALHPQRSASNPAQTYVFYIDGLTPQSAIQKAEAKLHEITQDEIRVFIDMPADNILTPQNIVQVKGTRTIYDQIYFPAHINRRWSFHEGYGMTIEAKNHAVESETSV